MNGNWSIESSVNVFNGRNEQAYVFTDILHCQHQEILGCSHLCILLHCLLLFSGLYFCCSGPVSLVATYSPLHGPSTVCTSSHWVAACAGSPSWSSSFITIIPVLCMFPCYFTVMTSVCGLLLPSSLLGSICVCEALNPSFNSSSHGKLVYIDEGLIR